MRFHCLTFALCCSFLTGPGSAQTPTWKVELVGVPLASWSTTVWAVAVADSGAVAGNTYLSGYKRAWIGSSGTGLSLLPLPAGANYSEVSDMNASGVIAGSVLIGGSSRGVIWTPGPAGYQAMLLPSGPGGVFPFDARGINDAGDVVGKYGILSGSYHWNAATGLTQITGFPVVPDDINNQRQVVGDTYRMDLDTAVVENLGNPTGTGFNYLFSKLTVINDIGQCGGYGNVASSLSQNKQAVRYTDGPVWRAFNSIPATSANVMGIAASGDTAFQLGRVFGSYVYVEGHGSIALQNLPGPAYSNWNLAGSFAPVISRGGRVACNGLDTTAGQAGIVLLTPLAFTDLGGASWGSLGEPVLSGYGSLVPGSPTRLRLASAAPGQIAVLAISNTSSPIPQYGGIFFANPASLYLTLPVDGLGRIDLSFGWPFVPPGIALYFQMGVLEPGVGIAMSNALRGLTN